MKRSLDERSIFQSFQKLIKSCPKLIKLLIWRITATDCFQLIYFTWQVSIIKLGDAAHKKLDGELMTMSSDSRLNATMKKFL